MHFGADYYPEHWVYPYAGTPEDPESRWAQDVQLMSAAGINVVRMGEFSWGICERQECQYDFDWLLVAAQSYQESGINQSVKSQVGAIGVMQILPTTAADPSVGIPDISTVENNVHAGVKYMRFMMNQYFKDAKMDRLNKGLFALASYNAGPAKVASMRKEAQEMGLDPNLWFNNVEVVASKRIGRETVQYVSNIYKYYISYKLIIDQAAKKKQLKSQTK